MNKEVKSMTSEEFKNLEKFLIDESTIECELFHRLQLNQPIGNRKINTGTIKYSKSINILETLKCKVYFQKEDNSH